MYIFENWGYKKKEERYEGSGIQEQVIDIASNFGKRLAQKAAHKLADKVVEEISTKFNKPKKAKQKEKTLNDLILELKNTKLPHEEGKIY